MFIFRPLLLLALLYAGSAAAQNVYRWTDESGKVHYGNKAPAGAKASSEVRDRINTYSGPPEVQRSFAPAAGQVVMYATSWCGYCRQARAHFARKGIRYVEHDVERSAAAKAEFKRLGGRGVPLILYGRERMNGFSPASFDAMYARATR